MDWCVAIGAYDNYIFDLYGTLIDIKSDEKSLKTWKKWCEWLDANSIRHAHYFIFKLQFFRRDRLYRRKKIKSGISKTPEIDVIDIYKELLLKYGNENLSEELIYEAAYQFRAASREYIGLMEGTEELLTGLHNTNKRLYILSNAQASYTYPEIKLLGLDKYMDDIIISSDYGWMKPDVKLFELILNKHNMDRKRTVMVGDSIDSDIAGAKKARIASIHFNSRNICECVMQKYKEKYSK